jgi:hypothetical protein
VLLSLSARSGGLIWQWVVVVCLPAKFLDLGGRALRLENEKPISRLAPVDTTRGERSA